jgi:hypothetical protein
MSGSQENNEKRGNLYGWGKFLVIHMFLDEEGGDNRQRCVRVGATMLGEFKSILKLKD